MYQNGRIVKPATESLVAAIVTDAGMPKNRGMMRIGNMKMSRIDRAIARLSLMKEPDQTENNEAIDEAIFALHYVKNQYEKINLKIRRIKYEQRNGIFNK